MDRRNRFAIPMLAGPLRALLLGAATIVSLYGAVPAGAVPETTAVRVTDVTASSFCLVWMTDLAADPGVEVYRDRSMTQRLTEGLTVTPMPGGSRPVAAAKTKGVMKVRVSGLLPATAYFARTVTQDPANQSNVSYSSLQEVTTASTVALYRMVNGAAVAAANDLVAFPAYVRPMETGVEPALGDLVILDLQGSPYPVSAFVGDGAISPEGLVDLNNLFGPDGASLGVAGGEKITLRVYRSGGLSTLTHYRRLPQAETGVSVVGTLTGFFADVNLDGRVDELDFSEFRGHYRTGPNDDYYNPDYNFVDDGVGIVDVREFGKFSREYGRTDVH
jgi:hypothetical protein